MRKWLSRRPVIRTGGRVGKVRAHIAKLRPYVREQALIGKAARMTTRPERAKAGLVCGLNDLLAGTLGGVHSVRSVLSDATNRVRTGGCRQRANNNGNYAKVPRAHARVSR